MSSDPPAGLPPELFLSGYPDAIRDAAEVLRSVVRIAAPGAIERVRPGWRIIGYDIPIRRTTRYFAFVGPEPKHIHLGFAQGIFMVDPDRVLRGAHLKLRRVRYLTYLPGEAIPREALIELTREAARITLMSPSERFALIEDRRERS